MKEQLERRHDAGALANAIVDIAVLKSKLNGIDSKVDDIPDAMEKGFKETKEIIWSIKNDIVQRQNAHDKKDDEREVLNSGTRTKVESIENRLGNVKIYLIIAVFFYIVGSEGLHAAVQHFLTN